MSAQFPPTAGDCFAAEIKVDGEVVSRDLSGCRYISVVTETRFLNVRVRLELRQLGRLMRDGATRFKQWSDRLAQALVDNLNRNVVKEHGAEEVARDKSKDH